MAVFCVDKLLDTFAASHNNNGVGLLGNLLYCRQLFRVWRGSGQPVGRHAATDAYLKVLSLEPLLFAR